MSAVRLHTSGLTSQSRPDAAQIRKQLARRIGRHRYKMWFGHSTRLCVDGQCLEVATDSQFVADWIGRHFSDDLHGVARETLGETARINVTVSPELFASRRHDGPDRRQPSPIEPAPGRPETNGRAATPARSERSWPRRCLGEFIVGSCNRLAFSAACRIADESEGSGVSPLFIHAECGLGKSHLLQGICRQFAENTGRHSAVRYVTGEQFTNEYITAVRTNALEAFRRRTRRLELLAIDDVHFLSNKVATQSEFLHTLDAIGMTGARIILASDEHPRQIRRFSHALVSRFLSGMVVRIDRPDRETRLALVRRLVSARGMRINDAAVEALVSRCVSSVRELEGAVTKLAAMTELLGRNGPDAEIGLVLIEQLFEDAGWRGGAPVRVSAVIDVVCRHLSISRNDLIGSGRHRRVVLGRGLVAYLARELTTLSFPEVAQALGRTYHSTVHTAAQRVRRQIEDDESMDLGGDGRRQSLRDLIDQLRHEIVQTSEAR